jgi:3-oxo-5-alpha-steroid 4-dehydrogenase 3
MSWNTWISSLSYLQLYWLGQSVLYALLLAQAVLTGQTSGRIRGRRDPDAKLGWLEFRKRTTLTFTVATVWLIYLTYRTVRGFCWGVTPSERFTELNDFLTQPKQATADSTCAVLALVLFVSHVVCRLYDCLRISIFSRSHVTGPLRVLRDHAYYFLAGLTLVSCGPALVQQNACVSLSGLRWFHLPALVLFVFASKIQHNTHQYLAKLRRNKSGHIVTTDYKQPREGWFETLNVSCPHYFSEILVYISIWITLGCNHSSIISPWSCLVIYVIANQLYRARDVQSFYQVKFEDYPANRKTILPFLF